jgi:hypothetical protein
MKIRVTLREGYAQLCTPEDLKRATEEMTRVLGFRGNVLSGELKDQQCILHIETSPSWGLPQREQFSYLEVWVRSKLRTAFVLHEFERETV